MTVRRSWCLLPILASPAAAQGLPPYQAVNPAVTTRSALRFEPLTDLDGVWTVEVQMDYGSMVEESERGTARFLLDAEVLRTALTVTRRLGPRGFVRATAALGGSYAGFLDAPLNGYHRLLGFGPQTRDSRPDNEFAYEVEAPSGEMIRRDPSSGFVGDLVLAGGIQHSPHWQTTLSLTLPTNSAPEGYGLETVGAAITTTARSRPVGGRLTLEGSAGVGGTPRAGALQEFQRTVFVLASGGARFRFWGRQSAYANFIWHSPVYTRTTMPVMDGSDVALDLGFLFLTGNGTQILAGLAEDLYPLGPAVDVVFRLGVRW